MTLEVLVSTGRCFVGQVEMSLLETRMYSAKVASDLRTVAESGGHRSQRCLPYLIFPFQFQETIARPQHA